MRRNHSSAPYPDLSDVGGCSLSFSSNSSNAAARGSYANKPDSTSNAAVASSSTTNATTTNIEQHKPDRCKAHYQVGDDDAFDYFATARAIDEAADARPEQFQNKHAKRKEKHMNKLIRFLLSNPQQCGHLTKMVPGPHGSKIMQFFKAFSGDRTASKEMLFEKLMIDYFRRGKSIHKERCSATDPMPHLQPSSFNIMPLAFEQAWRRRRLARNHHPMQVPLHQ